MKWGRRIGTIRNGLRIRVQECVLTRAKRSDTFVHEFNKSIDGAVDLLAFPPPPPHPMGELPSPPLDAGRARNCWHFVHTCPAGEPEPMRRTGRLMSIWWETRRDKIKTVAAETRAARWFSLSGPQTQVGEASPAQPGGLELQGDALIAACMMELCWSMRRAWVGTTTAGDWLPSVTRPACPCPLIGWAKPRGGGLDFTCEVVPGSSGTRVKSRPPTGCRPNFYVGRVCWFLTGRRGTGVTFDVTLNNEARLRWKSSWESLKLWSPWSIWFWFRF